MKILVISLVFLASTLSFAGTEGGGGDAVILPDGKVVLADVFLNRDASQPNNMPKQVALNPKLILQIKTYTNFTRQLLESTKFLQGKSSDILALLDNLGMNNNDLAFYSVADAKELNDFCASGGRKVYHLEDGQNVEQIACTSGNETYFVEPLFKRMTIIQQALLLFHERLTTFRDKHGGKNYQAIAGFTSGLFKILELTYEQQKGTLRKPTEDEVKRVEIFYDSVFELEYRNSEVPLTALDWEIHSNGGGIVQDGAEVDDSAFIGVTSVVKEDAIVGTNSIITETIIPSKYEIEQNVTLKRVLFKNEKCRTVIHNNSSVEKTTFDVLESLSIGSNSKIQNSIIQAKKIEVEDGLVFLKSEANLSNSNISLKKNQTLIDGTLTGEGIETYAPKGSTYKFNTISGVTKTECLGSIDDLTQHPSCVKHYSKGAYIPNPENETREFEGCTLSHKVQEDRITLSTITRDMKKLGFKVGDVLVITRSEEMIFTVLPWEDPGQVKNLSMIINNEIKPVGERRFRKLNLNYNQELLASLDANLKKNGAVLTGHYVIFLPYTEGL